MEVISVPRFIISGVSSRVGKSIVSLGLAVALRKQNVSLSCSVIGSDLLQPVFLRRLSRRYTRSLDTNILTNSQILNSVSQAAVGADLLMIEGRRGLYDGFTAGSLLGSDSEIAAMTKTPVVLVVDACGFGNSLAVLVKGFMDNAKGFSIPAVIANRLDLDDTGGENDRHFYDSSFRALNVSKLIGILPELETELPVPIGNFTQANSKSSLPLQFFIEVGNLMAEHVDLDALIRLAKNAEPARISGRSAAPSGRRTKIAVAEDSCFNLCYQDNLELLKFHGAELVPFSPLADTDLPKKIGAVYFPGCALCDYGEDLVRNQDLKKSLTEFAANGGVIYSEGSGTAYLCERFESAEKGKFFSGVGLIKTDARQMAPVFNYIETVLTEDSIIGMAGQPVKGISTGEWALRSEESIIKSCKTSYGGTSPVNDGYSAGAQIFSTFNFMHWGSNPGMAKSLVDASEIVCSVK